VLGTPAVYSLWERLACGTPTTPPEAASGIESITIHCAWFPVMEELSNQVIPCSVERKILIPCSNRHWHLSVESPPAEADSLVILYPVCLTPLCGVLRLGFHIGGIPRVETDNVARRPHSHIR